MQTAVQGGANPIGVTTGIYSEDELRKAGALRIIAGLEEREGVLGRF
jgi:phosphoglycolate phosphatase-like HAD superfamily hydrolase